MKEEKKAKAQVLIRLDPALRDESMELLGKLGLSLNKAIEIFLRQCIVEQAIPFNIRVKND